MQQQNLFNKIFNISENDTEAKTLLHSVIKEHPYFGLAQFYSLKNTTTAAVDHNEIAAKTNLFFNNAFYLNGQLLTEEKADEYIYQNPIQTEDELQHPANAVIKEEIIIEEIETFAAVVEEGNEEINNPVTEKPDLPQDDVIKNTAEAVIDEPQLLFEPLHASDYFASQGIKLSDDALANDKLGKQLKSFTAWLKTMKKVHPDKLPAVTTFLETAVQTQAEKSNIEEEIVTEPMAEAYIQQKKYAKAIEIYSKLSLHNPAKSAYFAAKIDSLKK